MRIRLIGSCTAPTAFARVNARWAAGLRARGHEVLLGAGTEAVDAVIFHDYERPVGPLGEGETSPGARRILVRSWDFGPYPPRWAEVVSAGFEELWVYSRWSRDLAERGGVPARMVRVMPLGIDPAVLTPDGAVSASIPRAGTVFLFVGATIRRKGFDVLLSAYRQAFSSDDDVLLVVKDNTRDLFYRDQHLGAVGTGARDPRITYIDEELDDAALAALYRAADVLVLPFRAEGFALPTLEAMACGTPPLVSEFGAVLDHCDATTAWFTPVRRVNVPVGRSMAHNTLGFEEYVDEVDLCEPHVDGLVDALRRVSSTSPLERAEKGRTAAARAAAQTWDAVAAEIEAALATG